MGTRARGGGGDLPSSACCREATPPAGLAAPPPPPQALTRIPSPPLARPPRISGFLCLRVLRHPSHAFPFTLFLIQTLGSEEVSNPVGAESGQRCRWPWSWAPRSCCLSDTPFFGVGLCAFLAAPGHRRVDPLPPWPPAGPSPALLACSVLCDWTFGLGPLKLDSRCALGRPEDP